MTAATGGHTWEGMLEEIGSSSDELFPQRNVTLVFVDAAPPHLSATTGNPPLQIPSPPFRATYTRLVLLVGCFLGIALKGERSDDMRMGKYQMPQRVLATPGGQNSYLRSRERP